MEKIRILSVFGTRPEAVKMAPVIRELSRRDGVECLCCVTGQHRELLREVLDAFSIRPDRDLDIMEEEQTLSDVTARTLKGMDAVMDDLRPDLVLVQGDTSATFVGALSAFYHRIPVGHVEAGLRTYDRYAPYPEEMNRRMVSALAELHFCPTEGNRENLAREGIRENVFVTGNTGLDALRTTVREDYVFSAEALRELPFGEKKVILVTCHRRENLGKPPLGVMDMHTLMARCYLVLTDSGGLQEEAPALGKPVLVLRRLTERPEAVESGTVRVAGVDRERIVALTEELLPGGEEYRRMARAVNPYGDGHAGERVADAVLDFLRRKRSE